MDKDEQDQIDHGFGPPLFPSWWKPETFAGLRAATFSGTFVAYDDPLDQARADSLEGGE
jgi:hypothetical protein